MSRVPEDPNRQLRAPSEQEQEVEQQEIDRPKPRPEFEDALGYIRPLSVWRTPNVAAHQTGRRFNDLREILLRARASGEQRIADVPRFRLPQVDDLVPVLHRESSLREIVGLGVDTKLWLAWLISGRPIAFTVAADHRFLDQLASGTLPSPGLPRRPAYLIGYRTSVENPTETWSQYFDRVGNDSRLPVQYLMSYQSEVWGKDGEIWLPQATLIARGGDGLGLKAPPRGRPLETGRPSS